MHSRILAEHTRALRAREELHTLFTGLSLRGSPADFIVAQIGEQLGSPVVLEGLRHHAVAVGGPGAEAESVLASWEQRSRSAHRLSTATGEAAQRGESDDWLVVPVEARGTRWGFLVALPGPPHPAGRRTVLEQGAVALALSRLADDDSDEWVRHSQQSLLRSLLGGRYSSEGAVRERFEAAGMPIRKHTLIGIAVAVRPLAVVIRTARDAARSAGLVAVVGANPGPDSTSLLMALSIPVGVSMDPALNLLVSALVSALAKGGLVGEGGIDLAVAIGSPAEDITGLLASLDEATDLLRRNSGRSNKSATGHARGTLVYRSENRPLLRLVTSLAGDPRLQAHAEQLLKPLIEHDLTTGSGDLLAVVAAFAAHPGNRTKAASESHLSRSVFYQRIALIEELLGMSLDDGEVVSALHTALLARGSR